MKLIEDSKIIKHSSFEPLGYVFTYKNELYRAINKPYEKHVLQMFKCGLIDELIDKDLFPKSNITEYCTSDCDLIIKHERIPVVTLPVEWTFTMLKEAALITLTVNIVARKYGYQTKDSHGFNVLFQYGNPVFVDLGSLVKINNDFNVSNPGWWAYGEFMRFFYAPLKIWSDGHGLLARIMLHGEHIPMNSYWRVQHFWCRLLPQRLLARFEFFYYKYKGLNTRDINEFLQFVSQSYFREKVGQWVIRLAKKRMLAFSSVNLNKIVRRIQKINLPKVRSEWGNYQIEMEVTDRHNFILDVINRLKVNTVLDLGGNAGLLARYILSNSEVKYIISADYDENAVDRLYNSLKKSQANIFPVLLNFGISIADTKLKTSQERLKSEAVMALALTHHLILSQGMTLDFIFERIRGFSSNYVIIEFMPLGCYSSVKKKIPKIPVWYNANWFRAKFKQYFFIIEEKQLEKNRILFVGQIPSGNQKI